VRQGPASGTVRRGGTTKRKEELERREEIRRDLLRHHDNVTEKGWPCGPPHCGNGRPPERLAGNRVKGRCLRAWGGTGLWFLFVLVSDVPFFSQIVGGFPFGEFVELLILSLGQSARLTRPRPLRQGT